MNLTFYAPASQIMQKRRYACLFICVECTISVDSVLPSITSLNIIQKKTIILSHFIGFTYRPSFFTLLVNRVHKNSEKCRRKTNHTYTYTYIHLYKNNRRNRVNVTSINIRWLQRQTTVFLLQRSSFGDLPLIPAFIHRQIVYRYIMQLNERLPFLSVPLLWYSSYLEYHRHRRDVELYNIQPVILKSNKSNLRR